MIKSLFCYSPNSITYSHGKEHLISYQMEIFAFSWYCLMWDGQGQLWPLWCSSGILLVVDTVLEWVHLSTLYTLEYILANHLNCLVQYLTWSQRISGKLSMGETINLGEHDKLITPYLRWSSEATFVVCNIPKKHRIQKWLKWGPLS